MKYQVVLLEDAENDIFDICRHILENDSEQPAEYVLDNLEEVCSSLNQLPLRGHIPPELRRISVTRYREIHFKPYRTIYEVEGKRVYVHCVLDGRRHLQQLLERRLIR